MKCEEKLVISLDRVLVCDLQLGHVGAHKDEDGFPWEECPTITFTPDDFKRRRVLPRTKDNIT